MAEVRAATVDDIESIVALGACMAQESPVYRRKNYDHDKVRALLHALVAADNGIVFVATSGEVIGMVMGMVVEEFFGHDLKAVELVVYVAPEHRGGSAAVKLVRAYEEKAFSMGVKEVVLGVSTNVHQEKTTRLYERMGYSSAGNSLVKRCT